MSKKQYTKEMFLKEIKEFYLKNGYDAAVIGKKTFSIFHKIQNEVDEKLLEKLIDIFTMEEGPEFAMTEKEFMQFLDDIENDDKIT